MNKDRIINTKGRSYDTRSGLPIKPSLNSVERSKSNQTINTNSRERTSLVSLKRAPKRFMDIAKSSAISRFAPSHTTKLAKPAQPDDEIKKHPLEVKTRTAQKTKQEQIPKSVPKIFKTAQVIKQEAIAEAMTKSTAKPAKKRTFTKRSRFLGWVIGCLVLLLLGFYLAYLFLPSLSVQIASTRAGIRATYPEYHPDGYGLKGPVTYKDNTVVVEFVASSGKTSFRIIQTKSSWDSTAVLENLVKEKVGNDYITTQERGLTIYVYSGNAAWVNGGILYTIEGNAPLSSEQIQRVAASL